MSPERKTNIKYGCVLVLMACIGTAFVMDANYRNSPRIPDVASGRIYDHQLKGIGTVYLTESEERPYRLLFWIGGGVVGDLARYASCRCCSGSPQASLIY